MPGCCCCTPLLHNHLMYLCSYVHKNTLGPNSLVFSFSSGASPAHNAGGRVLPLFGQQIFLTKKVAKRDGKIIVTYYLPLLKGYLGCCAVDRDVLEMFVSVTFIAMLMTPIARLFNVVDMCKQK